MSRYIDADKLIADLEYDIAIDEDILNYVGTVGAERKDTQFDKDCKQNAIDLLMRAPSIDIVRCGECKHCHYEQEDDVYHCHKLFHRFYDTEHYCSYGERKETDHE